MTTRATRPHLYSEIDYWVHAPDVCRANCAYARSLECDRHGTCAHHAGKRLALLAVPTRYHAPTYRRAVTVQPAPWWQRALRAVALWAHDHPADLAAYAVLALALGYLLWHMAAAIVEGRWPL